MLFKAGAKEIKPKKYIISSDEEIESGIFADAIKSAQVTVYDDETKIPVNLYDQAKPDTTVVISQPPVAQGLTEAELLAQMAEKAKKSEQETLKTKTEPIGGKSIAALKESEDITAKASEGLDLGEEEVKLELEAEVKSETKTDPEAEAVKAKGAKAKGKKVETVVEKTDTEN